LCSLAFFHSSLLPLLEVLLLLLLPRLPQETSLLVLSPPLLLPPLELLPLELPPELALAR